MEIFNCQAFSAINLKYFLYISIDSYNGKNNTATKMM